MSRVSVVGFLAIAVAACASGPDPRYEALSAQAKAQYAKYRQFMTERQRRVYLELPNDAAREAFVRELRVEERLSRFPPAVREAIWAQEVLVGMTEEQVILAWGPPEAVEREPERARKVFRYPGRGRVIFVAGRVVDVEREPKS